MQEEKNIISQWLNQLQRESWNLELLISGFSVFLLISSGDLLVDAMKYSSLHLGSSSLLRGSILGLLGIIYLATKVLIINLLLHVFLRGFWIGTIGLRSVQEKTDFESLGYTAFFTEKLRKNVLSLDELLIRLDTICSVIFAFTFLIVFMLFSCFLYILFVAVTFFLIEQLSGFLDPSFDDTKNIILLILFLFLLFVGFLYLFDTLTLGFLKKQKWLQKIYYPIYVFFGFITLSGIYRGIYYHLISRFSKAKIMALLVPYILLFTLLPFHKYEQYPFYPDNETSLELLNSSYDNQRPDNYSIQSASIPSMIVQQSYLPLFIRYNIQHNDFIDKLCTDYEPSKSVGIISGIKINNKGFTINTPAVEEENPQKLLACLSRLYTVYVNDSLINDLDYYYYTNYEMDEKGIKTVLPIAHLPKGKNMIKVTFKALDKEDQFKEKDYATIPFWRE